MIKFLSPSGHPLTAPESLAGKAGKCPKCNTPFVVPQPTDAAGQSAVGAAAVATTPATAVESDGGSGMGFPAPVTPAMGSGLGKAATGEVFVFLCPNGHKLNGPPSMKGKAGQCPHCGARFRIPTDEEMEEAETSAEDEQQSEMEGDPAGDEPVAEGGFNLNRLLGGGGQPEQVEQGLPGPPPGAAGLGYIVGRLWDQRTDQTELEIFLTEGEIVSPDYYSELLSTSDYGVFAIQEGDGSFAITVIPWSTVRRVGMRRLLDLSGDLFA
jgi:hypothetical protein